MVPVARVSLLLVFSLASAGDYRAYAFNSYQSSNNDDCAPADIDDKAFGSIVTLDTPGNMLVDTYRFTCNGMITGWEVQGQYSAEGTLTVEFDVWHPDNVDGNTVYRLVGLSIVYDAIPDNNTRLSHSIPEYEWMQVQEGDIVGFRAYNSSIRPSTPYYLEAFYRVGWTAVPCRGYSLSEDEQTPEILDPSKVQIIPALYRFPRMSVTVKTSDQPTDKPTTSSLITIVTVSSAVGIVILTVIASVAIYGCYRRRIKPKYRRRHYIDMDVKG